MPTDLQFQVLAGIAIALLLGVFGLGVYLVLRQRRPRELTPAEERARAAAVQSLVGRREFMREDSVLYLSDIWEVAKVSPSGALLHLQHTDGRETVVEARLVTRLSPSVKADAA